MTASPAPPRYVDLTMPLGPQTPVYPGDPAAEVKLDSDFPAAGYLSHTLSLGTHTGTHIDAPAHMLAGAALLPDFTLDRFCGRGVLVDARAGLTAAQLDHHKIRPGDIVLLWTGFSATLTADYYTRAPQIAPAAAAGLAASGASMVGVDAGSIDTEPFPVHKQLLGAGILLAENLIGLDQLAGTEFTVIALPLRLATEGAPARVIAALH